tara:strand:- start:1134 stop:1766 length:633 start_codon:yes stop_codon:yes gene_type:complete
MAVGTTTALLMAGGLAAGGTVLSARAQTGAAKSAARAQLQGQREALEAQEKIFERQLEAQRPFREVGEKAVGILSEEISKPIEATEGFRFRQEESERALNRALAARGLFNSGEAVRQSLGLTQRLAGQELGRRDQLLGSALGFGRQAANLGTQTLAGFGDVQSQLSLQRGRVLGQEAQRRGDIQSSLFSNLSALPIQGLGAGSQLGLFGA